MACAAAAGIRKRPTGNAALENNERRRMDTLCAEFANRTAAVPAVSGMRVVVDSRIDIEKSVAAAATTPCTLQRLGPSTVGTVA